MRLVGEAVGSVVVRRRRVGKAAVGVQRQCAVRRPAHENGRQRVAVDVRVVAEHAWRRHRQHGVFIRAVAVVDRHRRVVHGVNRNRHRRDVRVEAAVVRLVGKAVGSVVVGGRRVGEAAVGVQRQRAMRRTGHQNGGDRCAVDIAVVAEHARRGHRQRGVLRSGVAVVDCDRRIVHGVDRHRHCRDVRIESGVVRLVGETVRPVVVRRGRVGEGAVGVQRQRAVRRAAHQDRGQRVAVDVGVVSEHTGRRYRQPGVLVRAVAVIDRRRCAVHRVDGNTDRRHVRVHDVVVGLVREAVRSGVARDRNVGEAAVGVQRQRAVTRTDHVDRRQRVAVDVGVVREHTGRVDEERHVLVRAVAVVDRDWRRVDDGDRYIDRRGRAAALAIGDRVGERVAPAVARRGRVRNRPVGIDRRRAMQRDGHGHHRQRIAVGIGIVGQNRDRRGAVLWGRHRIVHGTRCGVRPGERRARHPGRAADDRAGDGMAGAVAHGRATPFVQAPSGEEARRGGRDLHRPPVIDLLQTPRVVPHARFVQGADERALSLPARHHAGGVQRCAQRRVLDAVEPRREGADDQRRLERAVQIQPPRRPVICRRRVAPRPIGRDHCGAHDRVVQTGRRILEVRGQHVVAAPDPQEVVHVDVAALGLGHPLGHERDRDDATVPCVGRNAGRIATEPGFNRELGRTQTRRCAECDVGIAGELNALVPRARIHRDGRRVGARQCAIVRRELQHIAALCCERRRRRCHRGVREGDGAGAADLRPLTRHTRAG